MVRRQGHFEATNAAGPDQRPDRRARGRLAPDARDRPGEPDDQGQGAHEAVAGVGGQQPGHPDLRRPDRLEASAATGDGPRKVVGFDISGVKKLKGLPVTGYDASFLRSGKATIKPTLRLGFWPFNYFGAVTTLGDVHDRQRPRRRLQRARAEAGQGQALALELKDVQLKWQEGGTWAGGATLVLRTAKSLEVGAGFGIKEGGFDYLRGSIGNLNKPIGSGIFLQSIGFEVRRLPASAGRLDRRLGRPVGGGREGGQRRRHAQGDARGPVHRRDRGQRQGGGQVQARRGVRPLLVDRPLRVRRQGRLGLLAAEPRRKRRGLGRRPPGVQRRGLAQGVPRRLGPRSVRLREGHPVVEGDRRLRGRLRVLRRSGCHVELRLRRVHRLRPRAVPGGQAGARAGRGARSRARGSRRGCEAPPGRSPPRAVRRA